MKQYIEMILWGILYLAIIGLVGTIWYFQPQTGIQLIGVATLGILTLTVLLFATFGVFTQISTGTEKYVIRGGEYIRTVQANERRFWLWEFFGVHFAGFSFQNYGWKNFRVNTDKDNPYAEKSNPDTWIQKGVERSVDFLLIEMPRMLVAKGLEIGGATGQPLQVDLGIQLLFQRALNNNNESIGHRFVFYFNADYTVVSSLVLSMIKEKVAAEFNTYKDVINAPDNVLDFLTTDLNLEHFGLRLTRAKIAYVATDQIIEKAARRKTEAEMLAEAAKAEASGAAEAIRIRGTAEADMLALKETAQITAIISALKTANPNADSDEILRMATDILEKKALPQGVTTLITDLIRK